LRHGDWIVFCDICGQRHYASETTKLPHDTGRGGLVVCKHDTDEIDPGLVPYPFNRERNVPFVRINNTDTDDGSPQIDMESMSYQYYLASSQDGAIIMSSQDDAWIISTTPV
jgi:hypothetical protein